MKTSTHQREHETSRPWQPVGLWSPMLVGAAALALVASTASLSLAADLSPQEAQKIGVDAFIYGYSLITSDITELDFGLFMRREPGHFPFGSRYGAEFSYCLGSAGT